MLAVALGAALVEGGGADGAAAGGGGSGWSEEQAARATTKVAAPTACHGDLRAATLSIIAAHAIGYPPVQRGERSGG
jgi:hypothetical protein